MNDVFLGIDLGTSSVKVLAVDGGDRVVAQASNRLTQHHPRPLWSEQDPEEWWQATVRAVCALPSEIRRAVRGLGLAGQMHGAVLLDGKDRVLRPAILWNDGRSAVECALLEQRAPRLRAITGNLAMPGLTAPKLLWVKHYEPGVFSRISTVLLPKDYLRLRLTGERISDMSDAAGTLWLDVQHRRWSHELLTACGLTRAQMPGLVEGTEPAGTLRAEIAESLGLHPVIVAGGGGDNAASAVGCGVVAPGQASLSLGTSGVLFVVSKRFCANAEQATHSFCHALPGRWHQMSVVLSAATALDWAAGCTGFSDVVAAARAAQQRGLRCDTPLFLPYLAGERTPHNNPRARGVFFGLTANTTGADLIVAVLEGVALAFADGMDALAQGGSELREISIVGGASRLDFWSELLASALNRSLTRRRGADVGAAYGAARLGRIAVTGEDPYRVCAAPPIEYVIEPNETLAHMIRHRRPLFSQLYRQLRSSFAELPL